jgi:hypothetical protein
MASARLRRDFRQPRRDSRISSIFEDFNAPATDRAETDDERNMTTLRANGSTAACASSMTATPDAFTTTTARLFAYEIARRMSLTTGAHRPAKLPRLDFAAPAHRRMQLDDFQLPPSHG